MYRYHLMLHLQEEILLLHLPVLNVKAYEESKHNLHYFLVVSDNYSNEGHFLNYRYTNL